jgi:hypothetical protein
MENINGKSRASFRWTFSCATMGLAVSVSLCFAQTSQEMQRVQEIQRLVTAPPETAPPETATPFLCDSLDPKVCLDIYRRRLEQTPERIPDNKAWPGGEFGQATAPFGKAPLPSFKLPPALKELQYGTRIK